MVIQAINFNNVEELNTFLRENYWVEYKNLKISTSHNNEGFFVLYTLIYTNTDLKKGGGTE